ncbi:lymphocyte antigen 75-like [Lytechinus variegatus]|uniref:lymphocyte antigen 75-like n=1 Tax=Lytechinus variegatus TaxID=7654 RepID=UPI001BB2665D|nr:lymphocyte antigen 75-like [Lytechinus variegatus]
MDFSFHILAAFCVLNTEIYPTIGKGCLIERVQFNGSWYHFSQHQSNFETAKASCQNVGMHLLTIGSQAEQDFLASNIPVNNSDFWIGLASVTWQDGSHLLYHKFQGYPYDWDNEGTFFLMHIPFPTQWFDDINTVDHRRTCICEKEGACNPEHVEFGGSCYLFTGIFLTFNECKTTCGSLGMHLVYVGSKEEQDFLDINQPQLAASWIGLGPVTWVDGSTLTYANFGTTPSTFDDDGEVFVMNASSSFQWFDDDGSNLHFGICEYYGACTASYKYIGSCYTIHVTASNFSTTRSACENHGMHLVSIGSAGEQSFLADFVISIIPDNSIVYWIGLESFKWEDGSRMTFNRFKGYSYDFNELGMCFTMQTWYRPQWFDQATDPSVEEHYICETEEVPCQSLQVEHNGSCYFFSQNKSTYPASKSFCETLDMHLVYIGSKEESDFLESNGPLSWNLWIGLSAVTWLDNSTLTFAHFGTTASVFDDGGISFVMNSSSSFQWFDDDSLNQHYYICEQDVDATESTTMTPYTSESDDEGEECTTTVSAPSTDTISATSATPTAQVVAATTATSTTPTTQVVAATTAPSTTPTAQVVAATTVSSVPKLGLKRSTYFKTLIRGKAIVSDHVSFSITASRVIDCGRGCLEDGSCSCFTYIAEESMCLLANSCPTSFISDMSDYERHPGAVTYSTLIQTRDLSTED